jgi:hypothetical protein
MKLTNIYFAFKDFTKLNKELQIPQIHGLSTIQLLLFKIQEVISSYPKHLNVSTAHRTFSACQF